jgi:integrase/recombinase XerD
MKKTDQALVCYLTRDEMRALLNAPGPHTRLGIHDRAMLHLAFAAGLRVSELVGVHVDQIDRQTMSSLHIIGKGRRERVLPLWKEAAATVKAWLKIRPASSAPELFLNARAQAMSRSGFEYILAKHVKTAARTAPSIAATRMVVSLQGDGHPPGGTTAVARGRARTKAD